MTTHERTNGSPSSRSNVFEGPRPSALGIHISIQAALHRGLFGRDGATGRRPRGHRDAREYGAAHGPTWSDAADCRSPYAVRVRSATPAGWLRRGAVRRRSVWSTTPADWLRCPAWLSAAGWLRCSAANGRRHGRHGIMACVLCQHDHMLHRTQRRAAGPGSLGWADARHRVTAAVHRHNRKRRHRHCHLDWQGSNWST